MLQDNLDDNDDFLDQLSSVIMTAISFDYYIWKMARPITRKW